VLAISCKTGEFELVGVYHAGYTRGSALNAVVGIDQIRDLITTLKRAPRLRENIALDEIARIRLTSTVQTALEPFFPLGSLTAQVRARTDGTLLYELFDRSFPLRTYPILVLEDVPRIEDDDFGSLGRVWFGNRQGLKAYVPSEKNAAAEPLLQKLLDGLRRSSLATFALREADRNANASRERFEQSERLEKALRRSSAAQRDLAQSAVDLAEHLAPQPGELGISLGSIIDLPPLPPPEEAEPPQHTSEAGSGLLDPDFEGPVPSPAREDAP
jgi:serine protease Do